MKDGKSKVFNPVERLSYYLAKKEDSYHAAAPSFSGVAEPMEEFAGFALIPKRGNQISSAPCLPERGWG